MDPTGGNITRSRSDMVTLYRSNQSQFLKYYKSGKVPGMCKQPCAVLNPSSSSNAVHWLWKNVWCQVVGFDAFAWWGINIIIVYGNTMCVSSSMFYLRELSCFIYRGGDFFTEFGRLLSSEKNFPVVMWSYNRFQWTGAQFHRASKHKTK